MTIFFRKSKDRIHSIIQVELISADWLRYHQKIPFNHVATWLEYL